jgi:hypothetical protein
MINKVKTSDDYDCSTAKKKKTNTSATQPSTLTQYKCPVCAKKLKTISGFRGHTQKQHGQNLHLYCVKVDGCVAEVLVFFFLAVLQS